jgi:hypothetical protein
VSRLAPALAPPPELPAAFLLLALAWGAGIGCALAVTDHSALSTRWSPALLALTHAFTLGLLGNALFGGLLQFLPAAAGGGRLGRAWGLPVGLALNLGTGLLLLHFHGLSSVWPAAALLGAGLYTAVLGLWVAVATVQPPALRSSLRVSLLGLVLTLGLGLWLLGARAGLVTGPRLLFVDVHAMLGLLVWVFGVLLCVSSLAVPMLQGAARWSPRALPRLLAVNLCCLLLAVALRASNLPFGLAVLALPLALAAALYLWQLVRAPWRRNLPLRAFFCLATFALLGAVLGLLQRQPPLGLLIWALGAGLALLVFAMSIEILAFLAWVGLQRRIGRRRRLPGVHQLQSDRSKWLAFGLASAALLLLGLGLGLVESLRAVGAALFGVLHLLGIAMALLGFQRARDFTRSG